MIFDFVDTLRDYVNFIPVCPELEMGLGVPRDPIRIVRTGERKILYQLSTGMDLTGGIEAFTTEYLKSLENVDGFILKSKSPSCGLRDAKIFSGYEEDAGYTRGAGFFSGKIRKFFPHSIILDENELAYFRLFG